jgi:hypothetical protein
MTTLSLTSTSSRPHTRARSLSLKRSSTFIASPVYDTLFFIASPVLALLLVEAVGRWPWAQERQSFFGVETSPIPFFIAVWSYSHAFAVFFRTHADDGIFVQHRVRFLAVPVALFLGLLWSDWLMIGGLAIAGFWAVYHLGMQNFGLCRIYDARCGNPPEMGRRLDYGLTQVLTLGPFIAGLSLMPTAQGFRGFAKVGWEAPERWLQTLRVLQESAAPYVVTAGLVYLAFYLVSYARLVKRGYHPCPQKIALFLTSGTVSILAWGFFTPWKAFFVMNFFHGLQYFAIVWWTERGTLQRLLRLEQVTAGRWLAFLAFAATTALVGIAYRLYGVDYAALRWAAALALSISLLHYWYDGFVWSVRKREV